MKIVVPLDLSGVAALAIEPAADIARGMGDQLLLLTVAGLRLRSDLQSVSEAEHTDPVEVMEQYLRSTAEELSDVDVEFRVVSGDNAAGSIVDFADEQNEIRMIVMATHGRTGMERWRLGNVTEKVVRHSSTPVLVVPTRSKG